VLSNAATREYRYTDVETHRMGARRNGNRNGHPATHDETTTAP
jgi:hypothetical protein